MKPRPPQRQADAFLVAVVVVGGGGGGGGAAAAAACCLLACLLAQRPSNKQVYLRDRSTETVDVLPH